MGRGGEQRSDGERLQKVLAAAGVASRRVCEQYIAEGRVSVNGEIVTELGSRVDPAVDLVAVDGVAVQLDPTKRYLMLNKPRGVVSSMEDERGRPDLRQFTADIEERVYNVGRLDADTTGLLILTNDGALAHVLAHPSFGVTKTYVATVRGTVTAQTIQKLEERDRPRRRPDRRRQGEDHRRAVGRQEPRRGDAPFGTQPDRPAHARGGRAPGDRARAAPVRAAAPRKPRLGPHPRPH